MEDNPFKKIADLYLEQVKECDEKGYADIFPRCFETLKKYLSVNEFTIIDEIYENGYFIMGSGTNSVVRFHIRELPGWLFGVWFTPKDEKHIKGDFFWQFEKKIDKFKPSASIYNFTISFWKFNDRWELNELYSARWALRFLKEEPCLAYCRAVHCWNYNEEYHSRIGAAFVCLRNRVCDWKEERERAYFNKKCLRKLTRLCKDYWNTDEVFVEDRGECVSPRYQIYVGTSFADDEIDFIRLENIDDARVERYMRWNDKVSERKSFFDVPNYVNLCGVEKWKRVVEVLERREK